MMPSDWAPLGHPNILFFLLILSLLYVLPVAGAANPEAGHLFAQGNACYDSEDYAAALDAFERLLKMNPGYSEAWINRGAALYQLDHYPAARQSFSRAVELSPESALARAGMGAACHKLEFLDEAAEAYREAVALDPAYAAAWSALGDLLLDLGSIQQSEEAYIQAHRLAASQAEDSQAYPLSSDPPHLARSLSEPVETGFLTSVLPLSLQSPAPVYSAGIAATLVIVVSGYRRLRRRG